MSNYKELLKVNKTRLNLFQQSHNIADFKIICFLVLAIIPIYQVINRNITCSLIPYDLKNINIINLNLDFVILLCELQCRSTTYQSPNVSSIVSAVICNNQIKYFCTKMILNQYYCINLYLIQQKLSTVSSYYPHYSICNLVSVQSYSIPSFNQKHKISAQSQFTFSWQVLIFADIYQDEVCNFLNNSTFRLIRKILLNLSGSKIKSISFINFESLFLLIILFRRNMNSVIQTFAQFNAKSLPISPIQFQSIFSQYSLPQTTQPEKLALLRQFVSIITKLLDTLLENQQKLCIKFFATIKNQFKDSVLQLLKQEKFKDLMWEYDSLFLGNDKQLIVYKKNYQLQIYLSKYRLPQNYRSTKMDLDKTIQLLIKLKIKKNIQFSLDKDYKQTQKEYSGQLKKFQTKKKKFFKLMKQILDHFCGQQGRYRLTMVAISYLYKDELIEMIQSKGLKCDEVLVIKTQYRLDVIKPGKILERFQTQKQNRTQKDTTSNAEQNHAQLTPQENQIINPNVEGKLLKPQISSDKSSQKLCYNNSQIQNKPQNFNKISQCTPNIHDTNTAKSLQKAKQITQEQPSKVTSFRLLQSKYNQVKIQFCSPSENGSPISHFNIYKIQSPMNRLTKIQQIPSKQQNKISSVYQIILNGLGYFEFTIKACNSVGESLKHQVFRVVIPEKPNQRLFMRGSTSNCMIPKTRSDKNLQKQQQQEEIYNPVDVNMPCANVVVSNCVMIHDTKGNLAAWGKVYADQKKNKVILNPYEPFKFQVKHVNKISCAEDFYLCCDVLGNVYGFGKNSNSELGIPKLKGEQTIDPIVIPYFKNKQVFVTDVGCKGQHSVALDSKGNVYCWGVNEIGPYGKPICDAFGSIKNFSIMDDHVVIQKQPRKIDSKFFGNNSVTKIAIGETFISVITSDKQLYTWGSNSFGQLGIGQLVINNQQYTNILCPTVVSAFNKNNQIIDIQIGNNHSLALCRSLSTNATSVYSWGNSINGECGHSEDIEYCMPKVVELFIGHRVQFVRAGNNISFVKTDKGLFQFGIQQRGYSCKMEELKFKWWEQVNDISSNSEVDGFLVEEKEG